MVVTCSRSDGSGMDCSFSSRPSATTPCAAENSERQQALNAGFAHYLHKPVKMTQLIQTLSEMLKHKRPR